MKPTTEQLEQLLQFDTPTLCNAIECFHVRDNHKGILSAKIKDIMGFDSPFVGYAVTAKVKASTPVDKDAVPLFKPYYEALYHSPKPSIAVVEDIDIEPVGSFWGEVNAHIHRSLGVVATVTNGGVRDIREVRPMGFGYFATCKLVSHAYIHLEDCNCPVNIFGVTIEPGEIMFCDQYGVIVIPEEIVDRLPEACRKIAVAELPVVQNCKKAILEGRIATPDELIDWRNQMQALRNNT